MSHSETCRKRPEAIEKRKLDKQLEEATRNAERPFLCTVEMEVEQPQEQPSTGGASSSSGPAPSGQEAVPLPSPSSHEVRVRSLAGILLFDENDTSDGQHSIREAHVSELSNEQHVQSSITCSSQTQTSPVCGDAKLNRNLICTVAGLAS